MISHYLTARQLCDLELIINGGFAPLDGFMSQNDYNHVLDNMCLGDGQFFPMPITCDIDADYAKILNIGQEIALKDSEHNIIATMMISDIWYPDKENEAIKAFGTNDITHPAVHYLFNIAGDAYIGGKITPVTLPNHYDFLKFCHTPQQLKQIFKNKGWQRIIAFQTRNPMHRAHYELTRYATDKANANLLIHPVIGMTKPNDVDKYTRMRCYEAILPEYPQDTTMLSLLNLAMRMAGPREALWHGLIRKNYGCTHIIIGRDHAGPGKDSNGKDFYAPYAAQQLFEQYQEQMDIEMIGVKNMVYVPETNQYQMIDHIEDKSDQQILEISGTQLRQKLQDGEDIPQWFSFPKIVDALRKTYPLRQKQGFTVFFTGYSGAGKSTIANALTAKIMAMTARQVTLLDGDMIRQKLSSELGFSKQARDMNIQRIGYVASQITKHHGIAICAAIAPYANTRDAVRQEIMQYGEFIEIHIATPLEECEKRDIKGLYKRARAGEITEFTGISDPYEPPSSPELRIDTVDKTPNQCADEIIDTLVDMRLI